MYIVGDSWGTGLPAPTSTVKGCLFTKVLVTTVSVINPFALSHVPKLAIEEDDVMSRDASFELGSTNDLNPEIEMNEAGRISMSGLSVIVMLLCGFCWQMSACRKVGVWMRRGSFPRGTPKRSAFGLTIDCH